jgi:hypothetical protein
MATKSKIDIVQHKSSLQAMQGPEWDKKRPECHTADEHTTKMSEGNGGSKRRAGKKFSS